MNANKSNNKFDKLCVPFEFVNPRYELFQLIYESNEPDERNISLINNTHRTS